MVMHPEIEIISVITDIKTIAVGRSIREIRRCQFVRIYIPSTSTGERISVIDLKSSTEIEDRGYSSVFLFTKI
jgi:hypothetical protein